MSTKSAAFPLFLMLLAATAPALGADICKGGPKAQWMKPAAIKEKLTAMGYANFTLHVEDGCYEAKFVDESKKRVEIYLDPVTGEVVKTHVQ